MNFKFKTEVVNSFLGECLIITDTSTNKNIEIMKVQADLILRNYINNRCCGSFPHGGYEINKEMITIYHDSERDKHEIKINIRDLQDILENRKGVKSTNEFISYSDLW